MKRALRLIVCGCVLLVAAGCPDLNQVQQFAKTADSSKSSVTAVASDFKASCDRQNLYVHLPPGPPPDGPPPKACLNGDDLEKLGNNLIAEQNILLKYIDALGSLAGTDASGFETAAPKLDASFKSAGLTSTQQSMAASVGTLGSEITKIATLEYRKEKILEILRAADPAVSQLTTALADQVATASDVGTPGAPPPNLTSYFQLLENEEVVMNSYYQGPLAKDPSSPAGTLLDVQYHSAIAELNARKDSAIAYRKLMLSIGVAHKKLLEGAESGKFDKSSIRKIAADLAQPISDMTNAIITLQKDVR